MTFETPQQLTDEQRHLIREILRDQHLFRKLHDEAVDYSLAAAENLKKLFRSGLEPPARDHLETIVVQQMLHLTLFAGPYIFAPPGADRSPQTHVGMEAEQACRALIDLVGDPEDDPADE